MNEEQPTQQPFEPQPINQPEVTPPVIPPAQPKKSKKKLVAIVIIILALVSGSAAAWFTLKDDSAKPEAKTETESTTTETEPTTTEFKDTALNISLKYPADWGTAKLAKGEVYEPGKGDYQQLTFSKRTNVDINFVLGGFSSPLDGCPDPLTTAKHDASMTRAWTIGWSGDNLKRYTLDYESETTKYIIVDASSTKGDNSAGWTKVSTDGEVLIYKDLSQAPVKEDIEATNSCEPVTKAMAEEANTYYNFTRFALNFNNTKVLGINAQYDTNKGEDPEVVKQLTEILKSIK